MHTSHWHFQILLFAFLLLSGCGQNSSDKTGDIPVIDIIGNLGNYEAVSVSQFATELEYIPLETSYDCLIGEEYVGVIVTSTYIFVRGSKYCYAFDRDGRFLGQIGSYGQGPGEYTHLTSFTMDEKSQSLYLETSRTLLEYSWDGVFRQSIDLPKNKHETNLHDVSFVRDNLFIGHSPNYKGDLLYNFVLFDQSSEMIKLFDNYVQFNHPQGMVAWTDRSMNPYRIGERIYVKEFSNDTLFSLTEENELVPHFVFDIGKYTTTKEMREYSPVNDILNGKHPEVIRIPLDAYLPMIGTHNHVFFSIRAYSLSGKFPFPQKRIILRPTVLPPGAQLTGPTVSRDLVGIYDMANQTTHLLDTDPASRMLGLINDLDGGLSFWPRYYTSDNELVDIWLVEDMKKLLTEEYFASHEIKAPAAYQKLKKLMQKLDEEDNPVIVIAKLRPELIGENR
ncbi:6-bladed beta-propeller [Parabacteroides sp. OttesenSCG-928-G07]|nr:6-bladed beta-propeller [Parabacteroides sp. OttesenSCG-928-G07]